jgi:probable HAF family extracellular repeat protein
MHDLGTIGGTAVFEVNDLNDRGEVVGGMYVTGDQSYHPFLWNGHTLEDLGTLGGNFGNADWTNQAGAVAGWSTTPGDVVAHAFLWRHGTMVDLGVTKGNLCSIAYVTNAREQVVGGSDDCLGNNPRAFIWEKGSIADLNNLVSISSGVQLTVAAGLNDAGEIAVQGVTSDGDVHAFLLIPCDENHPGVEGCDYSMVETSAATSVQPTVRATPGRTLPTPLWRRNNPFRFPGPVIRQTN